MVINMQKARAAIFTKPKTPFILRHYPITFPVGDQILVEMETSGLCGTDVHIYEGKLQLNTQELILGHEAIGTIKEMGKVNLKDACGQKLSIGDRVILVVAAPCYTCPRCLHGDFASCLDMDVTYFCPPSNPPHFHGGFGEIIYHPSSCAIKVPSNLNLHSVAAFACAGPTVLQAMEYAGAINAGDYVLVQGSGAVGLFATLFLAIRGAKVIMFGSSSYPLRLELAKQFGAELVFDIKSSTVEERENAVHEFTSGIGVDSAIEASGSPMAVLEGLNLIKKRGEYIIPGQYSSRGQISLSPEIITTKALKLTGSGQYAIRHVAEYLTLLHRNDISKKAPSIVTHIFSLDQINEAFETAISGSCVKILLKK